MGEAAEYARKVRDAGKRAVFLARCECLHPIPRFRSSSHRLWNEAIQSAKDSRDPEDVIFTMAGICTDPTISAQLARLLNDGF